MIFFWNFLSSILSFTFKLRYVGDCLLRWVAQPRPYSMIKTSKLIMEHSIYLTFQIKYLTQNYKYFVTMSKKANEVLYLKLITFNYKHINNWNGICRHGITVKKISKLSPQWLTLNIWYLVRFLTAVLYSLWQGSFINDVTEIWHF